MWYLKIMCGTISNLSVFLRVLAFVLTAVNARSEPEQILPKYIEFQPELNSLGQNTAVLCPEVCSCKTDLNETIIFVNCSSKELTEIPQIPSTTVYLSLQNNSIENVTCQAFESLISLKNLNLARNNISRLNRCVFQSQFESLELLRLSSNEIEMLDVGLFYNLSSLLELDLSRNLLLYIENNTFSNLKKLVTLHLSFNKLYLLKQNAFRGLRSLRSLFLENNELSSTFSYSSDVFQDLNELQVLNIKGNGDVADDALAPLNSLSELYMDVTAEYGLGPGYRNLTNLSILNVSSVFWHTDDRYKRGSLCRLHNISSGFFSNIRTNQDFVLILDTCGINNLSEDAFEPLSTLAALDLRGNVNMLEALTSNTSWTQSVTNSRLSYLDISHSLEQFSFAIDNIPFKYLQHTNLTTLRLRFNYIAYIETWPYFPKIQYLDVSRNSLLLSEMYLSIVNITRFALRELNAREQDVYVARKPYTTKSNKNGLFQNSTKQFTNADVTKTRLNQDPKLNIPFGNTTGVGRKPFHGEVFRSNTGFASNEPLDQFFSDDYSASEKASSGVITISLPKDLRVMTYSCVEPAIAIVSTIPHFRVVDNNVLQHVELINIMLKGWDGPVENVPSLEFLDLSKNKCTNMSTHFFKHMTNLQTLLLQENKLDLSLAADVDGLSFSTLHKLSTLNLSMNSISDLSYNAFANNRELQILNVYHNRMTRFKPSLKGVFNMTSLDLSHNLLSGLSEQTCTDLIRLKSKNRQFQVHLQDNRFIISCEYFQFLWLLSEEPSIFTKVELLQFDLENGTKLVYRDMINLLPQLACSCLAEQGFVYILIIFFIVVGSVSIFAVLYHNRWKLQYLYYISQRRLHIGGRVITYRPNADVFVTYEEDEPKLREFLQQTFLPRLRERNIRYIIGEVDFPGGNMMSHVTAAVTRTKKTIVLLSQDIFDNHHREFEVNLAIVREMDTRSRTIIPVFLEEADLTLYPPEIKIFLFNMRHRWMFYEDNIEFWRRMFIEIDVV